MITLDRVGLSYMEEVIDLAEELDLDMNTYCGCLLDNYIIYNTERIGFDGKAGKYIIAKETYLNEWSSCYTLIITDEISVVNEHEELFSLSDNDEE